MSDEPPFVSVKLPALLVNQAREAAQTMRRSVASQVEYWATLGRALEQAGLTTADSHALIARQERGSYGRPPPPTPLSYSSSSSGDSGVGGGGRPRADLRRAQEQRRSHQDSQGRLKRCRSCTWLPGPMAPARQHCTNT